MQHFRTKISAGPPLICNILLVLFAQTKAFFTSRKASQILDWNSNIQAWSRCIKNIFQRFVELIVVVVFTKNEIQVVFRQDKHIYWPSKYLKCLSRHQLLFSWTKSSTNILNSLPFLPFLCHNFVTRSPPQAFPHNCHNHLLFILMQLCFQQSNDLTE